MKQTQDFRNLEKKEAKEGTMYESGIGLNLNSSATAMDLNNSELSITELYGAA
jgi:hypothetical protein